jgi:hypothetical protein
MRMTFSVKYDDGRVIEAVAKPKDIVAFERQYGVSFGEFADEVKTPPVEWMFYLAWSPMHRQGREPRAFDEFLDDVDEIEPVEDAEGEPAPFPEAPSAETSPG